MLNGQRDLIARSQQLHYGLRVRGRAHVDAVHLQYSVAHPDFARLGRYSIGHHLQETQDLLSTIFQSHLSQDSTYMRYKDARLMGTERHARMVCAADNAEAQRALVLGQSHILGGAEQGDGNGK